jgi:tetratricopeptide (TPR) repeat protein
MPRRRITRRRLGRWLNGRLDLAGLLGLSGDDRGELAWQAHRSLEAGRADEAERIYLLMESLWPDHPDGLLGRGVCRQAQGDLAGAEAAYGWALAAEPGNPYALANRAEVYLLTDRPDAARADLKAALAALDRDGGPDLRRRVERLRELAEGGKGGMEPRRHADTEKD